MVFGMATPGAGLVASAALLVDRRPGRALSFLFADAAILAALLDMLGLAFLLLGISGLVTLGHRKTACWSHGRRKFVDLVKQGEAPIASEAVRRIDMLFEIERSINGKTPEQRLAVRRERSRPLIAELEIWMRQQRALLSTKNDTAKAINYLFNRWAAFTRFLDDGRVCLTNNAAERALRGVAVGRRNWTFAGSDAGGHRAAAVYTLIETCKMNEVDPQAWLADVLARLPDHPANKVADLLPWNWKANQQSKAAVAA